MTRDEAIVAAAPSLSITGYMGDGVGEARRMVKALEALGLIKFDEPAKVETGLPPSPDVKGALDVLSNMVIRAGRQSPPDSGWMIGPYGAEVIVARLNGAGYRVSKERPPVVVAANTVVYLDIVGGGFAAIRLGDVANLICTLGYDLCYSQRSIEQIEGHKS